MIFNRIYINFTQLIDFIKYLDIKIDKIKHLINWYNQ